MNNKVECTVLKECPLKPDLEVRPPLSTEHTLDLIVIFKMLVSKTRLRLLHALIREGELCVSELSDTMCMKPQAISNQLQILKKVMSCSLGKVANIFIIVL